MLNLKILENNNELMDETQLYNDKDLWNNGFDLDDLDFTLVSETELNPDDSFVQWQILNMLGNYCVGYTKIEYNNKFYYLVHHS